MCCCAVWGHICATEIPADWSIVLVRIMAVRALVLACLGCVLLYVRAQPNFPDGVEPIMRSVDMRSGALPTKDDKSTVAALMEEGEMVAAEDLTDEALKEDLKQSAYARVHLYVLRELYIGGCPRNTSACPFGWVDGSSGSCEPPAGYTGLCAGFQGDMSPTEKVHGGTLRGQAQSSCVRGSLRLEMQGQLALRRLVLERFRRLPFCVVQDQ